MAAAIERQLNGLLADASLDQLPFSDSREAQDRRRMFAAIARGVIEHLAANPDALKIEITSAPGGDADQYHGRIVIQGTDI